MRADVGAVVETVSVAVTAEVPVMATVLVEPKLTVGRSFAFAGEEVTFDVRSTLPVKPVTGVRVTCTVSPVVAPGASVRDGAEMVKPGGGAVDTTRTMVPDAAG